MVTRSAQEVEEAEKIGVAIVEYDIQEQRVKHVVARDRVPRQDCRGHMLERGATAVLDLLKKRMPLS